MRIAVMGLVTVAMLKLCGAADETVPVTAEAPPETFTIASEHGGTVLRADDHWVELVPKSDGTIEAYVADARGEPVAVAGTVVTVRVRGADGQDHAVPLRWNPDTYRFEGRLEVTTIAAGPTEVIVIVAGRPRRATASQLVIVQLPQTERATAAVPPRDRRASTRVEAPSITRPGVIVVAPPPPPRPGVVIVAPHVLPAHPGVVVHIDDDDRRHHGRRRRHRDRDDDHDEDFDEDVDE